VATTTPNVRGPNPMSTRQDRWRLFDEAVKRVLPTYSLRRQSNLVAVRVKQRGTCATPLSRPLS
jgi:hypothetical protein